MKKLVTFRLDPDLLERARRVARSENRSLTNFVETVLMRSIETHRSELTDAKEDQAAQA